MPVTDRILSRSVVIEGETMPVYLRIQSNVPDKTLELQIEELNDERFDKLDLVDFKVKIEATTGVKLYVLSEGEIGTQEVLRYRVRSENSLNVISDDTAFLKFIYKLLCVGTFDVSERFDIILTTVNGEDELEMNVVELNGEFAVKLIGIPLLVSGDVEIDLFEWFEISNLRSLDMMRYLRHEYQLNKLNDYKIKQLKIDSEEVVRDYKRVRESTDFFKLLLNEKKRKILELSGSRDVLEGLHVRAEMPLENRVKMESGTDSKEDEEKTVIPDHDAVTKKNDTSSSLNLKLQSDIDTRSPSLNVIQSDTEHTEKTQSDTDYSDSTQEDAL